MSPFDLRRTIDQDATQEGDVMTIAAILQGRNGSVLSISASAKVSEAVAMLADKRIGALPVMNGRSVEGIFSERDVIYGLAREGPDILDRSVGEVMISPPITATADMAALDALSLMTLRRIRHLPVVEGNVMIGFVSIGDLVKHRVDQIEAEAAAMRDYIQMA
jgi:CBS domain-containing protein